jgi:5'-nucleotidase
MTPRTWRRPAVAAAVALSLAAAAAGPSAAATAPPPVMVRLLAINDFHGNLEPPSGSSGTIADQPAGGAEYLATQLDALRAEVKRNNSITVAAGDLIGASPLLTAAFHDEPTIEALDFAGLDYASVGNHEFDEGDDELLRIQNGGCHPVDGCADPAAPYEGAGFQYLSANAFVTETDEPLLEPYAIHRVRGVDVGFIGMTLEGTPAIVSQAGVAGLTFADEIETANRYASQLQDAGVEAIVVLLHEGGQQVGGPGAPAGINDCTNLQGPIVPITEGMSDAIDVVVSGHTHQAYNCVVDGKTVTSASSFGRLVTKIDLQIDRETGDVIRETRRAENLVVSRTQAPDPAQTRLIARYRALLGPIAGAVVGEATAPVTREQVRLFQTGAAPDGTPIFALGESALGNLIADAQLAATDDEQGAVAAFMNPGGVRADLDAGPVTYEEAFTIQPFNNLLTTLDLTGSQLQCLLEQQFVLGRTLYPSVGVAYTVSPSGTTGTVADPCTGTRVVDASVTIGGTPVTADGTYRITTNNFLADGGDGFSTLTGGTNRFLGGLDLDAFVAYLTANSPTTGAATNRITVGD